MEQEWLTVEEAAALMKIQPQSVLYAIRSGKLPFAKIPKKIERKTKKGMHTIVRNTFHVKKSDGETYRKNKYIRDKRVLDGEKIYDLEAGRWSVLHLSRVLTEMLGYRYSAASLYFHIRKGDLRTTKIGRCFVIYAADVKDFIMKETGMRDQEVKLLGEN